MIVAACVPSRPEIAEWTRAWDTRTVVPDVEQFQSQPGRTLCDRLLAEAHGAYATLLPTPDPQLDQTIEAWILRVENLGYECPTNPDRIEEFLSKRKEILILEAEVAAALTVASNPESRSPS